MHSSYDMRVWEKKHATCNHEVISDFSHYKSFDNFKKEPFFYCVECCTRWYKGKVWNPEEWDNYVMKRMINKKG